MSEQRCDWCGAPGFLHIPTHGKTEFGKALCSACTDEMMRRVAVTLLAEGKALEAAAGLASWSKAHDAECGVLA